MASSSAARRSARSARSAGEQPSIVYHSGWRVSTVLARRPAAVLIVDLLITLPRALPGYLVLASILARLLDALRIVVVLLLLCHWIILIKRHRTAPCLADDTLGVQA